VGGATNLLDDHIDFISVLHVELLGGLGLVESFSVEEEAHVVDVELARARLTLWRWQKASMSFLNWVVALILKKTSSPSCISVGVPGS
jgi:hypothetical protein